MHAIATPPPSAPGRAGPEVAVLGAGIFGLACAHALARRGARVRVIDPQGPGAGASGGVLGALAPHAPESWTPLKAFQLHGLLTAEAFWDEVRATGGTDPGFARLGRLQPIADADALARARNRSAAAATLWQGRARWEVVAAEGGAWEPRSPSGWLIRDTLSARIHPRQALAALLAALAAQGVPVLHDPELAEGGAQEGAGAGRVLHATGAAGLAHLSAAFGRPVGRAQKGQAAVLALRQADFADRPQLYLGTIHVVPHADGSVAIGSIDDREAADLATDARLEALAAQVREQVPALAQAAIAERWAGWRPRARSRRPILGPWPGRAGHFIANGGFKIGIGLAPAVAEAMAALLLDGDARLLPAGCRLEDSL